MAGLESAASVSGHRLIGSYQPTLVVLAANASYLEADVTKAALFGRHQKRSAPSMNVMAQQSTRSRKQIAALPIARDADGALRVLVITTRETNRFLVPKGWPMKGLKDHRAAEIEAREEAGLIGRAHRKPLGSYSAWKRTTHAFEAVRVKVYLLDVDAQLATWKEKGQRMMAWLGIDEAAALIDEPGLAGLVLELPKRLPKNWHARAKTIPAIDRSVATQGIAKPAIA